MTPPLVSFDPNSALRPGRFDPLALIAVGVLRGAAPALFVIGLMYFVLTVGNHFESLPAIASPMQAFRALVSPLAIAAFGVLLRFGMGIAALLLAYPLSRQTTGSVIGPDARRPLRSLPSIGFTPAASTRTAISPGPGAGVGMSTRVRTSGPPNSV